MKSRLSQLYMVSYEENTMSPRGLAAIRSRLSPTLSGFEKRA